MITENEPMVKMNNIFDVIDTDYETGANDKINNIIGKLKTKRNCIIYQDPTFDTNDEENPHNCMHDVLFEASQNEINLNIELNKEDINKCEALYFFNSFNKCLKDKYSQYMFCSVMSLDNMNNWVFRFHIYRGADNMWVDKNINNYREPVMYEIF